MRSIRTRRWAFACAAVVALVAAACDSNWASWGNGPERHGESTSETTISPSNVAQLHELWNVDLGAYTNTAPIVANIDVNGTNRDVVFMGTEHGVVFATTAAGHIIWYRGVGSNTRPDCLSTPDGIHGVAASLQYDAARNCVYAVDGDGKVWAFNASTGATVAGWPVTFSTNGLYEIVESAPTLFGNHLYVETASYCDTGTYYGRIIDIDP